MDKDNGYWIMDIRYNALKNGKHLGTRIGTIESKKEINIIISGSFFLLYIRSLKIILILLKIHNYLPECLF